MIIGNEVAEGLYELPGEGLATIYTHGQKGVKHLRDKPVRGVMDFLQWVHRFADDREGRKHTEVSGFTDAMAAFHRARTYDQADMTRMLRAVPGTKFIPKGYFPIEVWAGLCHFNPNILRDGTLEDVLGSKEGIRYKDPAYRPTPRRFRRCRPSVIRVRRAVKDSAP